MINNKKPAGSYSDRIFYYSPEIYFPATVLTTPVNTGVPVSVSMMANANGRLSITLFFSISGRIAVVSHFISMMVTAAALVPFSSSSI